MMMILIMLLLNPLAVTAAGTRQCGLCTAGCHSTSHYIYTWCERFVRECSIMSPDTRHRLFYTPEFQMTVVELSSPVALLVAFWGEYPRCCSRVCAALSQYQTIVRHGPARHDSLHVFVNILVLQASIVQASPSAAVDNPNPINMSPMG